MMGQDAIIDSLKLKLETEAQENQLETLLELSFQYRNLNADSAFIFLLAAEEIASNNENPEDLARTQKHRGLLLRKKGKNLESIAYYNKAFAFFNEEKDFNEIAKIQYSLALCYLQLHEYEKCLSLGIDSRKNFITAESKIGEIRALNMLGIVMKDNFRIDEAIPYFEEGIALAKEIENDYEASHLIANRGDAYLKLEQYDKALEDFNTVLAYDRKEKMDWGIAYQLQNIANLLNIQERFGEAIPYLEESVAIKRKMKQPKEVAKAQGVLGFSMCKNGAYKKGQLHLQESLAIAKENNWVDEIIQAEDYLAQVQYDQKMYAQAYKHLLNFSNLRDSLWQNNFDSQVNELQTKYETAEKEKTITELDAKNELAQVKLQSASNRNIAFASAALIFGGLLLVLFRFYKRLKEQDKIKELLLKEIHHRVKNNLQTISSLLGIQSRSINDERAKRAIKEGQNRVKSMSMIHQDLYQKDNLSGVEMNKYLSALSEDLLRTYQTNDNIQLHTDIDEMMLDVDTVVPIGLIVNELITNCLKYAFDIDQEGTISVRLKEKGKSIVLAVSDDGNGLELKEQDQSNSFGHTLIEAFKDKLDANVNFINEDGLTVELVINNYRKVA